jgi:hypothetical protein
MRTSRSYLMSMSGKALSHHASYCPLISLMIIYRTALQHPEQDGLRGLTSYVHCGDGNSIH